jgi:hypothetical protein
MHLDLTDEEAAALLKELDGLLASTLVVEFLGRSAVWGCGGVEVVIGSTG